MRSVVGPFALRQMQGLDAKPSLRRDGQALCGTRGDKVGFVDPGKEIGLFRPEWKPIEKKTCMQKTEGNLLSNILI